MTELTALTKPKKVKKTIEDEEDEGSQVDEFTTVGKGGKAMQFTPESIFKNLQLVQEARGKKVNRTLLAVLQTVSFVSIEHR